MADVGAAPAGSCPSAGAKVWEHFLWFGAFAVGVFVPADSGNALGKAESLARAPRPEYGQQRLWELSRAIHSNTLLSSTRASHRWNCAVPAPLKRVSEQITPAAWIVLLHPLLWKSP